jgi:hypothetical protein
MDGNKAKMTRFSQQLLGPIGVAVIIIHILVYILYDDALPWV